MSNLNDFGFSLKDKSLYEIIKNYDEFDENLQLENLQIYNFDFNIFMLLTKFQQYSQSVHFRYNVQDDDDDINDNFYFYLFSFKFVNDDETLLIVFKPWVNEFSVRYLNDNTDNYYDAIFGDVYFDMFKLLIPENLFVYIFQNFAGINISKLFSYSLLFLIDYEEVELYIKLTSPDEQLKYKTGMYIDNDTNLTEDIMNPFI